MYDIYKTPQELVVKTKSEKSLLNKELEDYGLKNIDYDLKISLSQDNTIKIGEKNCDIIISDSNLQDKCLILTKSDNNLQMDSSLVRNMVTINGSPVRNDKSLVKNGSFFSILEYQFYLYNNELFTTSDGTVTTRLSNSKISSSLYMIN